jgi:hypothetical protein
MYSTNPAIVAAANYHYYDKHRDAKQICGGSK